MIALRYILSIDYGFSMHAIQVNDGIYYPDIQQGTYANGVGIVENFTIYLIVVFLIITAWRIVATQTKHP